MESTDDTLIALIRVTGGRRPDECVLAVWRDGFVVWSHDPLRGGPPHHSGWRPSSEIERAVEDAVNLSELTGSQKEVHCGPDARWVSIEIYEHGKQRIQLGSWHELFESNPGLVATQTAIQPRDGRDRNDILLAQSPEYQRFRERWDAIRARLYALVSATSDTYDLQMLHGLPLRKAVAFATLGHLLDDWATGKLPSDRRFTPEEITKLWEACSDINDVLRAVAIQGDPFLLLGCACACVRHVLAALDPIDPRSLRALEAAEAWASGRLNATHLNAEAEAAVDASLEDAESSNQVSGTEQDAFEEYTMAHQRGTLRALGRAAVHAALIDLMLMGSSQRREQESWDPLEDACTAAVMAMHAGAILRRPETSRYLDCRREENAALSRLVRRHVDSLLSIPALISRSLEK